MSFDNQTLKKRLEEQRDCSGKSLFDHLNEVFNFITQQPQESLFENFEKVSSQVKLSGLDYKDQDEDEKVNLIPARWVGYSGWVRDCQRLLKKQRRPTKILQRMPNFVETHRIFSNAGVSIGEHQSILLQNSLKNLMEQTNSTQMRFWGKIFTQGRDYYVAEGVLPVFNLQNRAEDFEPKSIGVNKFTYWVTHDFLGNWAELPDITANQVKASRFIKQILTGNLESEVLSYPSFPGKEKHLLRCQIARITHSSQISPRGVFRFDEETNEIVLEEEIALPTFDEIQTEEAWVHYHPYLLKAGRVAYFSKDEEEVDEELEALKAEDPEIQALTALSEDQPFISEKSWIIRVIGDEQQYATKDGDGNDCYATILIRSMRWPGAITVFKNGVWDNLYMGYGFKSGALPFYPIQPPDAMKDPEDPVEEYEPHPKEAPEELESDSDEEKEPEDDVY